MNKGLVKVDHSALRANQLVIITLNGVAFVLNLPVLALIVGLVMLAGTVMKIPGFILVYKYLFRPAGLLRPDVLLDHAEPHRFAQGFGGIFMLAGATALFSGLPGLGWGLVWVVAALAALNAFAGFCVGCMVYYWLSRLRTPGFDKLPPDGGIPGMRSRLHPVEVDHES